MWTEFWAYCTNKKRLEKYEEFSIYIELEWKEAIQYVQKHFKFQIIQNANSDDLHSYLLSDGRDDYQFYVYTSDSLKILTQFMRNSFNVRGLTDELVRFKKTRKLIPKHRRYIAFNQFLKNPNPNKIYFEEDVDTIISTKI